ncbi:MAG: AbrB/MazE/SpoVT family DNA-binding domain-containing protein [Thermococcus sp.]|nr:AbrB/MazE/SpoVT family DNA-binding domain-containing protein [Thermococcus sp.]
MKESREPLAKFHARVDKDGRLVIPRYIRDTLKIERGDYIKLIVRKIKIDFNDKTIFVETQKQIISKVGRKGTAYIPNEVRRSLNIEPDELVEVILLDIFKSEVPDNESNFKYVFLDV